MLKRDNAQSIFDRAMSVIAMGVSSNFRYWGPKSTPVISHAKGAYITDADENTFIDYRLGWGPIILGHADDRINNAVSVLKKAGVLAELPENINNRVVFYIIIISDRFSRLYLKYMHMSIVDC